MGRWCHAAVMARGLSRAAVLLPAPVPSAPVRDARALGGRDAGMGTAWPARAGTRGASRWAVLGWGVNLDIQGFSVPRSFCWPPSTGSTPVVSLGLLLCGERRPQELGVAVGLVEPRAQTPSLRPQRSRRLVFGFWVPDPRGGRARGADGPGLVWAQTGPAAGARLPVLGAQTTGGSLL